MGALLLGGRSFGRSACGGRESGIVQGSGTSVGSGAVADATSVGVAAPSGSASGEGTPDATVVPTDSSVSEAEGGSTQDVQDAEPDGACCGQPEPACAAGVCCVATDCPSSERCVGHTCQSVTCEPVQNSTYFVDPSAGIDDASSTGAANCPFRSLTHTLSVIGPDAGAGALIKIINDGFAPILDQSTGEVFPIHPPANVTITAEDTTKNPPTIRVTVSQAASDSGSPDWVAGFWLTDPGANLSHLVVDSSRMPPMPPGFGIFGILVDGHVETIDHVTVQNTSGVGIWVESGASLGFLSIGSGVVSRNNSVGLFLLGFGTADIRGGRGADHSSFSANSVAGIVVRDEVGSVTIEGTDIDPARPDESDVDTDNNGAAGLVVGQQGGDPSEPTSVVRGLHASGNANGVEVKPCARLTLRGSYTGNNSRSGVLIVTRCGRRWRPLHPGVGHIDLGNTTGPDYGRNIFQAPDASNANASICLEITLPSAFPPWPIVLAAGNIFGNTDCAVGGTLTRSATCSGQVDIGGISPDGGAAIDVSNCQ